MRYTILAIKTLLFTAVLLSFPLVSQAGEEVSESWFSKKADSTSEIYLQNEPSTKELNIDVLSPNNRHVNTNEDYSWRIEKLNEASPIQLDFNDIVKRYIDVYSVRYREKTAKILGLSEIYFPIFEEYLDTFLNNWLKVNTGTLIGFSEFY